MSMNPISWFLAMRRDAEQWRAHCAYRSAIVGPLLSLELAPCTRVECLAAASAAPGLRIRWWARSRSCSGCAAINFERHRDAVGLPTCAGDLAAGASCLLLRQDNQGRSRCAAGRSDASGFLEVRTSGVQSIVPGRHCLVWGVS